MDEPNLWLAEFSSYLCFAVDGCFNIYLACIGKAEDPACSYCNLGWTLCSNVRGGSVNGRNISFYGWDQRRSAKFGKLGSSNATKWRILGLCVRIRLDYNEMQDGNGVDETTNAKCIARPDSATLRYRCMIRSASVVKKRLWRKTKKVKDIRKHRRSVKRNWEGRQNDYLPLGVSSCSYAMFERVWFQNTKCGAW